MTVGPRVSIDRPDLSWQDRAACHGEDLDLFFPIGSGETVAVQVEEAKAVCHRCPVRQHCLEYSLERPERYGIFGGLDVDERMKLRRRAMRKAHAA